MSNYGVVARARTGFRTPQLCQQPLLSTSLESGTWKDYNASRPLLAGVHEWDPPEHPRVCIPTNGLSLPLPLAELSPTFPLSAPHTHTILGESYRAP